MSREIARQAIRIQNIARIGTLTLKTGESTTVQTMQLQLNQFEMMDTINSLQFFGITSSPPVGSDVLVLCMGGDNANAVAIATGHNQFRPVGMGTGETCIYSNAGQKVYLSQTGGVLAIQIIGGNQVNITCDTSVNITAPTVNITGNLTVSGTIMAAGDISSGSVTLETHRHSGVSGGSGTSGLPSG
jgi:phage baseplate assembly protein V